MNGLEGLPTWIQGVSSVAVFLVVACAAAFGYVSKNVAARMEGTAPKDSVVLSATIADGRAIRDLVFAVDNLKGTMDNHSDTLRNTQDGSRALADEMREMKEVSRKLLIFLENKFPID